MLEQTVFSSPLPHTQPLSPASYVTEPEPVTPPPVLIMEQKPHDDVLENNLPITPMTPPAGPDNVSVSGRIESNAEQSRPRVLHTRSPSAIHKRKPPSKRSRTTLSCTAVSSSSSSSSTSTSSSSESSLAKQPPLASNRKHTCQTCGKSFTRRDNLMAHQRVHTDERPYKCHLCPKRFRWMSAMRHHQDMHRRREKKRLLQLHERQIELQQQQQQLAKQEQIETKSEPEVLPTELIIPQSVPGPQIDEFSEFAHLPADFFDIGLGDHQDLSCSPTTLTSNTNDDAMTTDFQFHY